MVIIYSQVQCMMTYLMDLAIEFEEKSFILTDNTHWLRMRQSTASGRKIDNSSLKLRINF